MYLFIKTLLDFAKFTMNWKYSCEAFLKDRTILPAGEYCASDLNHQFDNDNIYGDAQCRLDYRKVYKIYTGLSFFATFSKNLFQFWNLRTF